MLPLQETEKQELSVEGVFYYEEEMENIAG